MNSPFENQPLQQDSPFKANGRFGRLSYAAWLLLYGIIFTSAFAVIGMTAGLVVEPSSNVPVTVGFILLFVLYIAYFYSTFILMIRRLHDRNHSGWLSLLLLVPFVNIGLMIYLFAAKGDEGTNDYGPARATPSWERILGWIYIVIIPILFIVVIIAIAVPSYQTYIEKSQQIKISSTTQP
ncbi:DUF805 domain-containing protein [Acinetobacter sp. V89_4]|uniref:DUF805 domain-containing protein n=1 Tax=Acinetobacter sp. V89_4 TaxID=3044232 RepID=UPI00249E975F|nr:DUF805 domain-containing protein [Acinetobacter sp. V89_4]MDI3452407.1 DUF805 domain-containing protein [Acinetobacter sp. V89_4]